MTSAAESLDAPLIRVSHRLVVARKLQLLAVLPAARHLTPNECLLRTCHC